jgi:hypothetical protein
MDAQGTGCARPSSGLNPRFACWFKCRSGPLKRPDGRQNPGVIACRKWINVWNAEYEP